jgi:hypothetical protein
MEKSRISNQLIDLEAANLATEWKHLFAVELRLAAQQLAGAAPSVTADHYRRALPIAIERVLSTIDSGQIEPADFCRRIA